MSKLFGGVKGNSDDVWIVLPQEIQYQATPRDMPIKGDISKLLFSHAEVLSALSQGG